MGNKLQNEGIFVRSQSPGGRTLRVHSQSPVGWTPWICFVLFLTMISSLFFSRFLLSASMIAFILVSVIHPELKTQVRQFFSNPLLWGMSLLFFIPLLSGLWSIDNEQWIDIMRIKLPLLLLPFAFAGKWELTQKQWDWVGYFFIGCILAGSLWTFFQYLPESKTVDQHYLQAKTMVTPLENDHVRFSWLVSVAILLCGWFFIKQRAQRSAYLFLITGTWFIIFLHLLAARTGLFSFYLKVIITAGWLVTTRKKRITALILLAVFAILPVIAYKTIPSFHNRVSFFLYEKGFFEKLNYLPGGNDAMRFISMKAGIDLMKEHPIGGTGFGDIQAETREWYELNYPGMKDDDKILPGSEWLIYGAGCGWPGILVFTFCMLIPFFIKAREKLWWWLLNSTAAFSFLFDIGLEVQFGVFIYAFVILWWGKWLKVGKLNR